MKGINLYSTVSNGGELIISLKEESVPEPDRNQVIVKVQATPINPSDIAILLAPADISMGETSGEGLNKEYRARLNPELKHIYQDRIGVPLKIGNEGAGVVVEAGKGKLAQSLMGKTVSLVGGEMFCQYRCVDAAMCVPLDNGVLASEAASSFVNPLTALSMVENMKMEGFKGLVHTAAASNLGQMLNRICIEDGIDLVNVVRSDEQEKILKSLGAKIICNSSSDTFKDDLVNAIAKTESYLAFDAIGGGKLIGDILLCMERAATQGITDLSPYGSSQKKQVYVYGALDLGQTSFTRNFGFTWSISAWLLTPFLNNAGSEVSQKLRNRVFKNLKTTFASHYEKELSLTQLLDAEEIKVFGQQATAKKYLLNPSL